MAATGQTGMGFPEGYGGGGDIGASIAAFETLPSATCPVLVKVGVQFGLFGGAVLQLGTKGTTTPTSPTWSSGRLLRLLRDDRVRPRFQRAGARHGRDLRPRRGRVRRHHDPRGRAGLHRQRRRPRRVAVFAPSSRSAVSGTACTPSSYRSGRGGEPLRRRADRGRRPEDGPQRRRQRPASGSTTCGCREALLNRFADVTGGVTYDQRDREPQPPVLHDARHPGPGPVSGRAGISAAKVALTRRHQVRRAAAASSRRPDTAGGAAARLRPAPAPAVPAGRPDLRPALRQEVLTVPSCDVFSGIRTTSDSRAGCWSPCRRHQGAGDLARDPGDPGEPRGGGAGYLAVNRFAALKADTDVFTTFEGDNHVLLQLVAKGPADRLRQRLRGPRPARHGPLRGGARRRDHLERTSRTSCSRDRDRACPVGRRHWDTDAGLLDPVVPPGDAAVPRGAPARRVAAGSSAASTRT